MTGVGDENLDDLLQASVDGELDAAAAARLAERRRAEPEVEAAYQRLLALRRGIAAHVGKDRASTALRERIAALASPATPAAAPVQAAPARLSRRPSWLGLAAAVVIAFGLGGGGASLLHRAPSNDLAQILVADHMRGLLAQSPVDVISTDRHTVKPWFDEHLALSPLVADLTARGITLVGGRVDVVNGKPVPTLVYRLREHLISLTAVPATLGALPPVPVSEDGYSLEAWRQGDFLYFAVSDVARDDLSDFVAAFKSAAETEVAAPR